MDSTLRDGGYENDFSFTAEDTSFLCKNLEEAGVEFIEVGHGQSMGARAHPQYAGSGTTTDEDYLLAAKRSLKKAKFGMFFCPGISTMEHIDLAARQGMDFIRVGINATDVPHSEPYIKKAKEAGLFVFTNYMKSYVLGPDEVAQRVQLSEEYGADVVYLVDSAGCMLPDDMRRYFSAIRRLSTIKLGFHGHDSLGLATANSLAAAEEGFEFIDGTLRGLGRSGGNAPTEVLAAVLSKAGHDTGVDLFKLLALAEDFIVPRFGERGRRPLDVAAGFAGFHSSFLPLIVECAKQYGVDPAVLITEVSKKERVRVDRDLVERVAKDITA
ncbi:MAG: 4-hydroxy-2-oxovalerate aldolase [Candidatus Liptonbacteria bacterium]|nr:4-hydroxy-2-oxovalerate aldolase [Candidatus Liptonbacteria bacterium]